MRPARRLIALAPSLLWSLLGALACVAPARADDGRASAAMAAAQKVRAALPEPVEPEEGKPGPNLAFEWKGDLVKAGENAGSVTIDVSVGEYHGKPVWVVTEVVADEWAGTKRTTEASYFLARDLTLEKAEWKRTTADKTVDVDARRDGDGLVVKTTMSATGEGGAAKEPVKDEKRMPLPAGATFG